MKANLRSLVEKTVTSLIPWLFITLIVFYFVYESVFIAGIAAIFAVAVMFIIKRLFIQRKQRHVVNCLVEHGEFKDDNVDISFCDDETWCSGIMELRGIKFFCMATCNSNGLMLKLPTLFRRKTLFIRIDNIKLIESPENSGYACIKLHHDVHKFSVPWKNSFDKYVSKEL